MVIVGLEQGVGRAETAVQPYPGIVDLGIDDRLAPGILGHVLVCGRIVAGGIAPHVLTAAGPLAPHRHRLLEPAADLSRDRPGRRIRLGGEGSGDIDDDRPCAAAGLDGHLVAGP